GGPWSGARNPPETDPGVEPPLPLQPPHPLHRLLHVAAAGEQQLLEEAHEVHALQQLLQERGLEVGVLVAHGCAPDQNSSCRRRARCGFRSWNFTISRKVIRESRSSRASLRCWLSASSDSSASSGRPAGYCAASAASARRPGTWRSSPRWSASLLSSVRVTA